MMKKMFNVSKAVKIDSTKTTANALCWRVTDLLVEFDHLNKKSVDKYGIPAGVQKMYGTNGIYWKNKGWLLDIFRNHPDYDGQGRIIFKDVRVQRYVNPDFWSGKFLDFVEDNLYDVVLNDAYFQNPDDYWGAKDYARNACRLWRRMCAVFNYLINEAADKYQKEALLIPKDISTEMNEMGLQYGFDFRITPGKVSKAIQKIFKVFGLDKVKDEQIIRWTTPDGEYHEKVKDFGWNYKFATLSDSINPCFWDFHGVLSVNPLDFYTMSFGDNWASCHTIDKENKRKLRDDSHHYGGMYCGGTESYALDRSTMIFYYVSSKAVVDENIYKVDKCKRVVMYFNGYTLVTSRLYPDGRDGSHSERTKDGIVNLAKNALADALGVDRSAWAFRKEGRRYLKRFVSTVSGSAHYEDYNCYSDMVTTHLVTNKGIDRNNGILIGHTTVCPNCGGNTTDESMLLCDNCIPKRCDCCGELFLPSEEGYNDRYRGYSICESCFLGVCSRCGDSITNGNAYDFNPDGELLCGYCAEPCDFCNTVFYRNDLYRFITDTRWSTRHICPDCIADNGYIITTDDNVTDREHVRTDTDGCVYAEGEVFSCETCGGYHSIRLWDGEIDRIHERMGVQMRPMSHVNDDSEEV